MQNYKDVCGERESVWFEIDLGESEKFFKWAKDLGCVWLNGQEIMPTEKVEFFHYSISKYGKLAVVPMCAWVSKTLKFDKYLFREFIKKF